MPFALRWANEEDEPAIKRLVRESNLNRLGIHWQRFLVAEDLSGAAGAIVGIGQVKVHGDGSRELASIATVPDRRGEGIATAIIEALLSAQTGDLYLTCRAHNEKFYERFGFRRVERSEDAPPYFRRLVRLMNVAAAALRVFGRDVPGMVMARKGG
ncbi:MAG: GNAT family N-acetyltransferase [Anaerolineae bacterium]|jgi:N-acetylglutamate synthase-like GNAT family acetyltransferase|nr:GNAT family N-acetyltransferase [Anaerolineae bacterium]